MEYLFLCKHAEYSLTSSGWSHQQIESPLMVSYKGGKKEPDSALCCAAWKSDEGAPWELRPKSTCIPVTLSAIIGLGTQIKIDETLKWLFGV